ncbi:plasma membrane localization protein, partial [Coemansia aciculifera]
RYVKHATLIERCFPPEKSAETVPNSNELSYLVYYVQSKPAKLTKVGAYLSKRAAKDVQRRRRSDVYVALRVYDALLNACARDLNFFAKDVLGTLDVALSVDDIGYTEVVANTFALFCRCHTGLTLAIDKDLSALYSRLISTFAAHAQASYTNQRDASTAAAMKRIDFGLRAIQAIAESEATYASDAGYELPRIVNAVLGRIASAPASIAPIPAVDQSTDTLLDDDQLGRSAWRCLETLVRRSHGQHSRAIVAEIFKYLDSVQKWQPVELCVQVVTSVIGQLQSQDQNMVIVETLALLADGTLSSHAAAADTNNGDTPAVVVAQSTSSSKIASRRACIIRILENLFCQPYILVGISVMEALSVLVAFLLQSIEDEPHLKPDHLLFASTLAATSAAIESEETTSVVAQSKTLDQAGPVSDHYHLLAAIGGLAKHQYYSDQLADIAGYLVSQLRLDVPVSLDDEQGCVRQIWLLQSLSMVLHNSYEGKLGLLRQSSNLSLDVFAPLFTLITHDRADLSAQAVDCIIDILRYNGKGGSTESTWASAQRLGLDSPLSQKLGGSSLSNHKRKLAHHRSAGHAGVAAILCELLSPACATGVQQTLALVGGCQPEHSSASWVTLLAMVWAHAAKALPNSQLGAHVSKSADEAKRVGCWDNAIEDVCLHNSRVVPICFNEAQVPEPQTEDADKLAKSLADKLSNSTVISLLGSHLYSSQATVAFKPLDLDSSAADRALCDTGNRDNSGALSPPKSVDQTKHARARVSVDWETQARRDSTTVSQIGIGHLRAALRDGLTMRSSDHVDSIEHNAANGSTTHQPPPILATNSSRVDAYGQPVSSEVCDLLDSIDDVELSTLAIVGDRTETRNSPTICTPVISNFD